MRLETTAWLPVTLLVALSGCYPDQTCTDCADTSTADGTAPGDDDGDTIGDDEEGGGLRDTDGDTVPDSRDLDSDDDGWPDAVEAGDDDVLTSPRDSDADTIPDYLDEDSDANGIDDVDESDGDSDGDGQPDRIDLDDDDDGCIDPREGSADRKDADGDTVPDYQDGDSDGDGIDDVEEGCLADCDDDGIPNRVDFDSDGNTIPDAEEAGANTDEDVPTGADTVPDWCDDDNDGDGIDDVEEMDETGTDPQKWDTDGDGDFDYLELVVGTDPLDGTDSLPDDLLIVGPGADSTTYTLQTELPRVDLTVLAGTGGDLAGEVADLSAELPAALSDLSEDGHDVRLALAAFEDFGDQGYGPPEAAPLSILLRSTSDAEAIAGGLDQLAARAALMAGSIEERSSGVEAVYQVLTGEGLGEIIDGASCPSSPLDPDTSGAACMRTDSYPLVAVLTDRLTWSPYGCLPMDTSCTYDDEDFPETVTLHRYPETAAAAAGAVRLFGVVAEPEEALPADPAAWLARLAEDSDTVTGGGEAALVDVGDDAGQTTELLMQMVTELLTTSPFDGSARVLDLPDSDPQPEGSVIGYGLAAYPGGCEPASGPWGTCTSTGPRLWGVGPGVQVTVELVFTPPAVHPRVDVLAFEVEFAVEGRLVIDRRTGYLVVPESFDPEL